METLYAECGDCESTDEYMCCFILRDEANDTTSIMRGGPLYLSCYEPTGSHTGPQLYNPWHFGDECFIPQGSLGSDFYTGGDDAPGTEKPCLTDIVRGGGTLIDGIRVTTSACGVLEEFRHCGYNLTSQLSGGGGNQAGSFPIEDVGLNEARLAYFLRKRLEWHTTPDCYAVVLRLWSYEEAEDSYPPVNLKRVPSYYEVTVSREWMTAAWQADNFPITIGPFTLFACTETLPQWPRRNICCVEFTMVVAAVDLAAIVTWNSPEEYVCSTTTPLWSNQRYSFTTDLCMIPESGFGNDVEYVPETPTGTFPLQRGAAATFEWHPSEDGTKLFVTIYAAFDYNESAESGLTQISWNKTVEIDYTPDWFETPITMSEDGLEVTMSVCGAGPPICDPSPRDCFPKCISGWSCDLDELGHTALFIDVDGPAGCCLNGTVTFAQSDPPAKSWFTPLGAIQCPVTGANLTFSLYCDGGVDGDQKLTITGVTAAGEYITGTMTLSLACVDGEVAQSFTFISLPQFPIASSAFCPGFPGVFVFTIFSNNH